MSIQPGDFGANLNRWFQLLGRKWKPLLAVSLVAYVPLAVSVAAVYLLAGFDDVLSQLSDVDFVEAVDLADLLEILAPLLFAGSIAVVLQLVATAFVYLSSARIVAEDYSGLDSEWRAAGRFAGGRMGRAVGAGAIVLGSSLLVMGLVVAISWVIIANLGVTFVSVFLAAVIALTALVTLTWLSVSVSLYSQSIAMSDRGVVDSLRESFRLVQGRWWVTVGFLLVASLIASVILQLLNFALVPLLVAGTVVPQALALLYGLSTVIQGPVVAAMSTAYAIWYVDLRARHETLETGDLVV